MQIYRKTIIISGMITFLSFLASFYTICGETIILKWLNNISIGLFSSGILILVSSIIGYIIEEKNILSKYQWKLSELKYAVVELQTIPEEKSIDWEIHYNKIKNINFILKNYFAVVDTDFLFYKRKKIQKLLEIQTKLYPLVRITNRAMECLRVYINAKKDDKGERNYGKDEFIKDIKEIYSQISNYDNSNELLAMWLIRMEQEYGEVVFNIKSSDNDMNKNIK